MYIEYLNRNRKCVFNHASKMLCVKIKNLVFKSTISELGFISNYFTARLYLVGADNFLIIGHAQNFHWAC